MPVNSTPLYYAYIASTLLGWDVERSEYHKFGGFQ